MSKILSGLTLCTALVAIAPFGLITQPALAHDKAHHDAAHQTAVILGELSIRDAYARATLPSAPVGGAFMTIQNSGAEADRLLSVTARNAVGPVGREVQIHEMAVVDGVMTMRPLPNGLELPAGTTVTLEPGGLHLMIMGLDQPLVEGEALEMDLTFEKAGKVAVPFEIRKINAKSKAGSEEDKPCPHSFDSASPAGDAEAHDGHDGHAHGAHSGHDTPKTEDGN